MLRGELAARRRALVVSPDLPGVPCCRPAARAGELEEPAAVARSWRACSPACATSGAVVVETRSTGDSAAAQAVAAARRHRPAGRRARPHRQPAVADGRPAPPSTWAPRSCGVVLVAPGRGERLPAGRRPGRPGRSPQPALSSDRPRSPRSDGRQPPSVTAAAAATPGRARCPVSRGPSPARPCGAPPPARRRRRRACAGDRRLLRRRRRHGRPARRRARRGDSATRRSPPRRATAGAATAAAAHRPARRARPTRRPRCRSSRSRSSPAAGLPAATGLGDADLVYVSFPSAGRQRALALFQSSDGGPVGPVGDVRPLDTKLLLAISAVLEHSGGTSGFLKQVARADLPSWSSVVQPSSFRRDRATGASSAPPPPPAPRPACSPPVPACCRSTRARPPAAPRPARAVQVAVARPARDRLHLRRRDRDLARRARRPAGGGDQRRSCSRSTSRRWCSPRPAAAPRATPTSTARARRPCSPVRGRAGRTWNRPGGHQHQVRLARTAPRRACCPARPGSCSCRAGTPVTPTPDPDRRSCRARRRVTGPRARGARPAGAPRPPHLARSGLADRRQPSPASRSGGRSASRRSSSRSRPPCSCSAAARPRAGLRRARRLLDLTCCSSRLVVASAVMLDVTAARHRAAAPASAASSRTASGWSTTSRSPSSCSTSSTPPRRAAAGPRHPLDGAARRVDDRARAAQPRAPARRLRDAVQPARAQLVRRLVGGAGAGRASLAQLQPVLGVDAPRPAAPFAFTNAWGCTLALLLVWLIVAGWVGRPRVRAGGRRRRRASRSCRSSTASTAACGSASALAVVYVAAAAGAARPPARHRRPRRSCWPLGTITFLASPLQTLVSERLAARPQQRDPLVARQRGAATPPRSRRCSATARTRAVRGSTASIAVGKTDSCPKCGNAEIGSTGQYFLLLVAQGFLGTGALRRVLPAHAAGPTAATPPRSASPAAWRSCCRCSSASPTAR